MNRDVLDEKDMLELFNYISNDDKEDERVDLKMNDLRKKKLRKNLMKQINSEGKARKFKYKAAAVALVCIISAGILVVPAFARNIPVLNSIIQSFNDKNGEYQKYSQAVNNSATDKGITITINEVLCDNNQLIMAYTIKSDGDIRDVIKKKMDKNYRPFFLGHYLKINGKDGFGNGGDGGKYIDDHTYVGSCEINVSDKNLPENINVDLNIRDIGGIEGNWKISFSYSKKDVLQKTKVFKPNTSAKLPEATINIKKVTFTPINTSIVFTGKYINKDYKDIEKRAKAFGEDHLAGELKYGNWFVYDDNSIEVEWKNFFTDTEKFSPFSDFHGELKCVALKSVPKYLTIIPYNISKMGERYKWKEECKPINGAYPIELSQGKIGKTIVKDIEVQEDRTIVRYTTEGLAPLSQARSLFIRDAENNPVYFKNKSDAIGIGALRKEESKPNEYVMELEPLDKNKKYIIGTANFDGYDIREDLKFKIDLSDK